MSLEICLICPKKREIRMCQTEVTHEFKCSCSRRRWSNNSAFSSSFYHHPVALSAIEPSIPWKGFGTNKTLTQEQVNVCMYKSENMGPALEGARRSICEVPPSPFRRTIIQPQKYLSTGGTLTWHIPKYPFRNTWLPTESFGGELQARERGPGADCRTTSWLHGSTLQQESVREQWDMWLGEMCCWQVRRYHFFSSAPPPLPPLSVPRFCFSVLFLFFSAVSCALFLSLSALLFVLFHFLHLPLSLIHWGERRGTDRLETPFFLHLLLHLSLILSLSLSLFILLLLLLLQHVLTAHPSIQKLWFSFY